MTGLFYRDPRLDAGADFERLLGRIEQAPFRIDPGGAARHLARFSMDALRARVARLLELLAARGITSERSCA